MLRYTVQSKIPTSQYIQLNLLLDLKEAEHVKLQLPAWRAGRYQIANYAQNIRAFAIKNSAGAKIPFQKTTKDLWEFSSNSKGPYLIFYEYYCGKMDGGSAWVDEEQVYVNLVNCCFDVLGKSEEEIEIILDLPEFSCQTCTLIQESPSIWKAKNFQMLADSTILASKRLIHWEYQVQKTQFHIWIQGEVHFDKNLFLNRFNSFSEKLIQDFGEFPESEYHFIFQLLPYSHYHGVEHRRGTVITFGPAEGLKDPIQMEELLGVSCHELYHAWNVCRIRPKELLPYDFSKETYTKAGLILEGVTTYMGDLYLLKSGVYDLPTYLRHFEKVIDRESANFGWRNYTIQESSFDLWLDGYIGGIPDRKVNIYTRGALLAICMDILLLKNGSALATVMTQMWEQFGKPFLGYGIKDFENLIIEQFQDKSEINSFFTDFVQGYEDLFPFLQSLLSEIGIEMKEVQTEDRLLHQFGIRTNRDGLVIQIHPDAKAYFLVMKNDKVLNFSLEGSSEYPELLVSRQDRTLKFSLEKDPNIYFPLFQLSQKEINTLTEKWLA
jgi:predicted metalloprotease with PDZ domain